MASFAEPTLPLEFLLYEGDAQFSREKVTIVSGSGVLAAGRVLGKITVSGKYKPYDDAASDGSQTAVAILAYPVDATSADVDVTAIVRFAVVKSAALGWGSQTTPQITNGTADLAALNPPILVRS